MMEDRWAKLEEIVRRVVREELSTWNSQKKRKIGFKNGQFTGLGEIEMAALEAAYPAVDVKGELREMRAWLLMNPDEAPASDFGKFINTWLKRHQNQASLRAIPTKPAAAEIKRRACAYCSLDAVGVVHAIPHCRGHYQDAYEEKPRRMLGVVPKPVAGND